MSTRFLGFLPLLVTLVTTSGCVVTAAPVADPYIPPPTYPTTTAGVATSDMLPSMSATSHEDGTTIWAALIGRGDVFLRLGAGDALTATAGGVTQTLTLDPTDANAHFTTHFAPLPDVTNVVVSLHRSGSEQSALDSVVPIPSAFTVTAPSTFATSEVMVQVTPGVVGPFTYQASGPCVNADIAGGTLAAFAGDDGSLGLDLSRVLTPAATASCALTINLMEPMTAGTWDPAFGEGDSNLEIFQGEQVRTIATTYQPATASK